MIDKINLDYYQHTAGPRVRIVAHTIENMRTILYTVVRLKNSEISEISCREWGNVVFSGFYDLVLRTKKKERRWLNNQIDVCSDTKGLCFIWEMCSADWENCEGLIEGLLNGAGHGFQYLLESNIDIVLCYDDD